MMKCNFCKFAAYVCLTLEKNFSQQLFLRKGLDNYFVKEQLIKNVNVCLCHNE